jgi:alpha-amylase
MRVLLPVSHSRLLTSRYSNITSVWISPVNQNYDGPRSAYGDAYHGYWSADVSKLNDRFGTAEDLKALSAELHRRDMYVLSQTSDHSLT